MFSSIFEWAVVLSALICTLKPVGKFLSGAYEELIQPGLLGDRRNWCFDKHSSSGKNKLKLKHKDQVLSQRVDQYSAANFHLIERRGMQSSSYIIIYGFEILY
jgi:hypothetical protein